MEVAFEPYSKLVAFLEEADEEGCDTLCVSTLSSVKKARPFPLITGLTLNI